MFKRYRLRDYDFKLVLLILALSAVGVIAVGSAEPSLQNKQLAGVVAGVVLMVVVSLFDYTMVIRLNWLMYVANLVLLVAVWQLGDETKGATRWLTIGGLRFQPSETAKILLILFFAQFIMKHRKKLNTVVIIASCVVMYALPWILVWKQPDLSTSIVLLAVFCIIMFAGGISLKLVFGAIAVAIPAVALVISLALQPDSDLLTDNQKTRVLAFVNPQEYETTYAYQQLNSVTAIASGQLEGKGYKNNEITSVKNGNFLSEAQTDFIFSVIGEEFGFKGSVVVIVLLFSVALECISVARKAKDVAGTIIAASMGGLVAFQGFFNIGVATFILPTTGLTLPFVSNGLTSLLSLFIGMGFVLNVRLQAKKSKQ
ncbi:FtsW/RodA/SpoVE family cell cycle protein [uncultured Acetatifactor sp.]|uniref:FtsW/RodA/SpoVE family cell cycle protein n=2 Tax=uncultured Acetatifactor sp. TaxID=1671927 RepID=UPI0026183A20|nr:FtsW/RodA/SpoVE family cell cycle protein [uncultured Acetatifactor sp.]MCI8695749.1 rod shape-determining protein RodA [Lachnospiraceae bacterium]